jgi:hydrogenase maturation protein HypF
MADMTWTGFGRGEAELPLPVAASSAGVCAGAELNNTVAVVEGGVVRVSRAIGDLRDPAARAAFTRELESAVERLGDALAWIACDRHPAYASRTAARRLARARGVDLVEVQHHHAHLASCLAEHASAGPAIGLICDGVGYGEDGQAWGGECLVGDLRACRRAGRLRPIPLPGGDLAATHTGRCAAGWLFDAMGPDAFDHPLMRVALPDEAERGIVARQVAGGLNCPSSSGMGRLFDAAASLLGLCPVNDEPAAAGRAMEAAAGASSERDPGAGLVPVVERDGLLELDHRPLLRRLADGVGRGEGPASLAWIFHFALADGLSGLAGVTADQNPDTMIVNSGGVFCNALLADLTSENFRRRGLRAVWHHAVPPHDAGLSIGQAAIAAALTQEREPCASPRQHGSSSGPATTPGSPSAPPGSA